MKIKILANDGISLSGKEKLEQAGFEVLEVKVAQEQLPKYLNDNHIEALLVRSATKVPKALIDACPQLKVIGRGGVGLDNIDVAYAKKKGINVVNTPSASSRSVAELVFAHLLGGVRFLHNANRDMPLEGDTRFKQLKKSYEKGNELLGKTLGIIGFGRIGQATAKMAIGLGMKVVYHDLHIESADLELEFYNGEKHGFRLRSIPKRSLLEQSDFITIHTPASDRYIIDASDFDSMKEGVGIINLARGGVLDEVALVDALDSDKVSFAGLDVFESEPNPELKILMHPKISLTPHIGSSTNEAQDRIGLELAQRVIELLG